ncbi:hypothetical protein E2320_017940, partial [Naja naja]
MLLHVWFYRASPETLPREEKQRSSETRAGASQHIANDPQTFFGLRPAKQTFVSLANGQRSAVKGEGKAYVPEIREALDNVLYVPELDHKLISISSLDRQGYEILFAGGQYSIRKGGRIHPQGLSGLGIRDRHMNLYSPAENGVFERRKDIMQIMKDSLLADAGMGRSLKNSQLFNKQNMERKPSLGHLRTFGSYAWVHSPKGTRRKGQKKARELRFVGFEPSSKDSTFTDRTRKVVISQAASFAELNNWNRVHANSEVSMPTHSTSSPEGEPIQSPIKEKRGSRSEVVDMEENRPEVKREVTELQGQVTPRRSERRNNGCQQVGLEYVVFNINPAITKSC